MSRFTALRVHARGNDVVPRIEQLSLEDLSPGEVTVRVTWSGINYKDALAVSGRGKILRGLPRVPGIDLAGVVEDSQNPNFRRGQPVLATGCNLGEGLDGGFSQFARLPAAALVPLPAGLELREAMILGTAGFTAAMALRRMLENHQRPDQGPIAVTGATGGVGSIALNLFSRQGFAVHAITGKAAAADYLRGIGAIEVVDRKTLTFGTRPLEPAIWGGAVDNLGGDLLAWLTRTVRPWGNIACIGLAASPQLSTTVMPLILRGVSLLGIHSVECPRVWRLAIWERLSDSWKPTRLERLVAREITLAEIPAACTELIESRLTGRILVRIGEAG
ncbi:MAG: YhdH/YhfP family quinone oxidoreductase [Gammaproteobacteria bacterium]|nr:YhdH/YhfP family quinone oxidoreductase [Gammaproteobacteria bacterium]